MAITKIQPYIVDSTQNFTFNNVTATGNVVSLNANLGNLATANYVAGVLTTSSQPNITSIGALTSLTVTGNIIGGTDNSNGTTNAATAGSGGGGGGGGAYATGRSTTVAAWLSGAVGAVRIIWGTGRAFPATNTGNL